ncbi:hypothetical protein Trydic_g19214 [Trypoxylus dichotomus]
MGGIRNNEEHLQSKQSNPPETEFDQCILQIVTYGGVTLTLTKTAAEKLRMAQGRMERSMLGLTLRDRLRNEEIRTGIDDIVQRVAKQKWRWVEHIGRKADGRLAKRLLAWRPRNAELDLPTDGLTI